MKESEREDMCCFNSGQIWDTGDRQTENAKTVRTNSLSAIEFRERETCHKQFRYFGVKVRAK